MRKFLILFAAGLITMVMPAALSATANAASAPGRHVSQHAPGHGPYLPTLPHRLQNYNSLMCLGTSGGHDNAPAIQWSCNTNPDQVWTQGYQNAYFPGWYQLVNNNGDCLGVAGGSLNQGAQVVGWQCLGSTHWDQYWQSFGTCHGTNGTYYAIENLNSGMVVGVTGNSRSAGAAVVQWPYQGLCNNQFWHEY